ncbi:MAG: metallophosphoesterase [Nitrospirota bacterium]|nr:MAG: metallophosphoesterase [Nitrospirota bacterium]
MNVGTFGFLVASALVMIQCSPLHNGIIPLEPGRRLSPETFSVALMGDIPYTERQVGLFNELIKEVNADPTVDLVLHAGDIKGRGDCDDQVYLHRFDLIQQFKKPFIFTVGDNEWTDCHDWENGQYHPLDRLHFLRTVFFANPLESSGGNPIPMRSQSSVAGFEAYVEHRMVLHKRIVFGTLHVIGSNNGLAPWSGIDPEDAFDTPRRDRLEEFKAREYAAIQWLNEIFRFAQEKESPGIVILIQANPLFDSNPGDEERAGFNGFINALRDLTVEYGKPVLLAHGHIHYLLIDKPLYRTTAEGKREQVPTLTRIQTGGSPLVRWIKVTMDPQSPEVFLFVEPFIHKLDSMPW